MSALELVVQERRFGTAEAGRKLRAKRSALRAKLKDLGFNLADKATGEGDPGAQAIEDGGAERQEDTRRFPTEAEQAAASARDVLPKKLRGKTVDALHATKSNTITLIAESLSQKYADVAQDVLALVGIKTRVTLVDEVGMVQLIEGWQAERDSNKPKIAAASGREAAQLAKALIAINRSSTSLSPELQLMVSCVVVLGASLAGGWLPALLRLNHSRLQMAVSMVSGLMLGLALLHLFPHGAEELGSMPRAAAWCR